MSNGNITKLNVDDFNPIQGRWGWWGGGGHTSFFHVTSPNLGVSPQNIVAFSVKHFVTRL